MSYISKTLQSCRQMFSPITKGQIPIMSWKWFHSKIEPRVIKRKLVPFTTNSIYLQPHSASDCWFTKLTWLMLPVSLSSILRRASSLCTWCRWVSMSFRYSSIWSLESGFRPVFFFLAVLRLSISDSNWSICILRESRQVLIQSWISQRSFSAGSILGVPIRPSLEYAFVLVSRSTTLNRSICWKTIRSKKTWDNCKQENTYFLISKRHLWARRNNRPQEFSTNFFRKWSQSKSQSIEIHTCSWLYTFGSQQQPDIRCAWSSKQFLANRHFRRRG